MVVEEGHEGGASRASVSCREEFRVGLDILKESGTVDSDTGRDGE